MRIIAGSARGRRLLAPPDRAVRPALDRIRESVFSILGDRVEGTRVLDLFAGTGALGLEALSRGAESACFVDRSQPAALLIEKNVWNLGFQARAKVFRGDALTVPDLEAYASEPFGVVFLDPPFAAFAAPVEAARVFQRLRELVLSRAVEGDARVILRLPSNCPEVPPITPFRDQAYGDSRVLFFHPW